MPIGPGLRIERVGLQQRIAGHPLDDIVTHAGPAEGGVRVQMQVKTNVPVQGKNPVFIDVMAQAAEAYQRYQREIEEGAMLLGLVAGGPHEHLAELKELAMMARPQLSRADLRRILSEGITRSRLRDRYNHVVAAVRQDARVGSTAEAEDLAFRILKALVVWHVDAGPDGSDTRLALDSLKDLLPEDVSASEVFAYLCDLAEEYGPCAGTVDANGLRRELRSRHGVGVHPRAISSRAAPPIKHVSQLPPVEPNFCGRADELRTVRGLARPSTETISASGGRVAVIAGKPGVGKTALAVRAADELKSYFNDAQLFVDLRGVHERPARAAEVLGQFLHALGQPDTGLPDDEADRAALFRSLTANRRVLIVLDNASSTRQVESLLPGPGPSFTIVTSRKTLAGLTGTCHIPLDVLPLEEAVEFMVNCAGNPGLTDDTNMERIAELCGRLPLALRVAASHLAGRRAWTTSWLARSLQEENDRLDKLSPEDFGVRASFNLSYKNLPAQDRRAFRLLATIPDNRFDIRLAAAATDLPERNINRRLDVLLDAHLLDCSDSDGEIKFHDLLKLYARERLLAEEKKEVIEAAEFRIVQEIIPAVVRAGQAMEMPARGNLTPEEIKLAEKGLHVAFLDRKWPVIHGTLGLLVKLDLTAELFLAARSLERYVHMRDLWESWETLILDMRDAARRQGFPELQLLVLVLLNNVKTFQHDPSGAADIAEEIGSLIELVEDPLVRAEALNARGNMLRINRRTKEAIADHEAAREIYREYGADEGFAACSHNIGSAYFDIGHYDAAIESYQTDLSYWRKAGDPWNEAWTMNSMGDVYARAGMTETAIEMHSRAFSIYVNCGDWAGASRCLNDLGIAFRLEGRVGDAIACHMADLEVCTRRSDIRGIAMALQALGDATIKIDLDRAEMYLSEAHHIASEINDLDTKATSAMGLATIFLARGDIDAQVHVDTALRLYRESKWSFKYAIALRAFAIIEAVPAEKSSEYLKEALTIFKELGASYEEDATLEIITAMKMPTD
jgi:tetratricopeptide (TPR) repeat protein